MKLSVQKALLTSFLIIFGRIIACWKGLEQRNLNTLQDITIGKVLHVRYYKIKNMDRKMRQIPSYIKNTIEFYASLERLMTTKSSDGNPSL